LTKHSSCQLIIRIPLLPNTSPTMMLGKLTHPAAKHPTSFSKMLLQNIRLLVQHGCALLRIPGITFKSTKSCTPTMLPNGHSDRKMISTYWCVFSSADLSCIVQEFAGGKSRKHQVAMKQQPLEDIGLDSTQS